MNRPGDPERRRLPVTRAPAEMRVACVWLILTGFNGNRMVSLAAVKSRLMEPASMDKSPNGSVLRLWLGPGNDAGCWVLLNLIPANLGFLHRPRVYQATSSAERSHGSTSILR